MEQEGFQPSSTLVVQEAVPEVSLHTHLTISFSPTNVSRFTEDIDRNQEHRVIRKSVQMKQKGDEDLIKDSREGDKCKQKGRSSVLFLFVVFP